MSLLVTGATGQDGSYLLERLVAEGESDLHALLRPGEERPEWLAVLGDAVALHEAELSDAGEVVHRVAPDEVVHLAGVSSVARSWEQPVEAAAVNGLATAVLLDACRRLQERRGRAVRVVQACSAEVFAGTTQVPQDERTPLAPRSPYGAAKAYALHLGQVHRAQGLPVSSAVLYNHESPRRPPGFVTRRITLAAAAVARGEAEELVLGNLDAQRDWGWAPDYVDALLRMLRAAEPADLVVATGEAHTVREFALAALARAGVADGAARLRSDPALVRPTDAAVLVGDASRARERLGWAPTVAFDEVVGRMVDADLARDTGAV